MSASNKRKMHRPYSRRDVRSLAFHVIYAVDRGNYEESADELMARLCDEYSVEQDEDAYALTLARGVIAERDNLDKLIAPLLQNWKMERLGCCTLLILRIGIWECLHTDLASSVVINEAVELAKAFAEKDAHKFVNGLLDRFVAQREAE